MRSTELASRSEAGFTRRAFARRGLVAGLAVAGTAAIDWAAPLAAQGFVDKDILQFALNLEYLEAEFYTVAVTGQYLKDSGIQVDFPEGHTGDTTGGGKVALSGSVLAAAQAVMQDEQAHVKLLQAALGGTAVSKPAINLNALGLGFNNQNEFLTLARAFEDTGVSAYGGAAPLLSVNKNLATAARILAIEAEHTGVIRQLISEQTALVVPPVDRLDIVPPGSPNGKLISSDGQGLAVVRTPDQVLNIVYGGNRFRGGFFPDGVNSALNTVLNLG